MTSRPFRSRFMGLALLTAGCGAAAERAAATAPEAPVKTVTVDVAVVPSRPPRVAKPEVRVELTHFHRFVTLRVPAQRFRRMETAALARLLPAALKSRLEQETKSPDELRKVAAQVQEARLRSWECRAEVDERGADSDCPPLATLQTSLYRAEERLTRAGERALKKNGAAAAAFQKASSDASLDQAAVAMALARVHELRDELSDITVDNHPAAPTFDYGEPPDGGGKRSFEAEAAYQEAKRLARPGSEVALHARLGVVSHLWSGGEVAACLGELEELERSAPSDLLAQVRYLVAVLRAVGPEGDYAKSAEALRGALAADVAPGAPSRSDLLLTLVLAEYRAGRFAQALEAAIRVMEEERAGRQAASVGWALRGATISPRGVERIAADCIERLGDDKADLSAASPEAFAAIQVRLALRAWQRGDVARARRAAESVLSRAPDSGAAGDAIDVLAAAARADGNVAEADALVRKKEELSRARRGRSSDVFATLGMIGVLGTGRSVEEDERKSVAPPPTDDKPAARRGGAPPAEPPAVQRNVESLVRLCLEPSYWRIARRASKASTLEIEGTVYDDGTTEVSARATGDVALDAVLECLRAAGPRALVGAPTGVRAIVDVSQAQTPEWIAKSGLLAAGASTGGALDGVFGAGGIGLPGAGRGLGGAGGGIGGIGTVGKKPKATPKKRPAPAKP